MKTLDMNNPDDAARFLKGWSKGKQITKHMGSYYKCGKWMTRLEEPVILAMIERGYAVGGLATFKIVKVPT